MPKIAMLAAALLLAAGPAHGLSGWWTPVGKRCPSFDGEEACERWCAGHREACGGSDQCEFRTGDQVPECPPPAG